MVKWIDEALSRFQQNVKFIIFHKGIPIKYPYVNVDERIEKLAAIGKWNEVNVDNIKDGIKWVSDNLNVILFSFR